MNLFAVWGFFTLILILLGCRNKHEVLIVLKWLGLFVLVKTTFFIIDMYNISCGGDWLLNRFIDYMLTFYCCELAFMYLWKKHHRKDDDEC